MERPDLDAMDAHEAISYLESRLRETEAERDAALRAEESFRKMLAAAANQRDAVLAKLQVAHEALREIAAEVHGAEDFPVRALIEIDRIARAVLAGGSGEGA